MIRFTSPFEFPFRAFEESFSRMLQENQAAAATNPAAKPWSPSVDIRETANELVVKADLPGVNENDVDLRIEDGTLILKGERKFENESKDEKGGYHRIERSYGSFARYFSLPDTVDPEKVTAEYKNGVLTVTLAKKEIAKPKQIKVAIQ
jgi:HSP20 family protein